MRFGVAVIAHNYRWYLVPTANNGVGTEYFWDAKHQTPFRTKKAAQDWKRDHKAKCTWSRLEFASGRKDTVVTGVSYAAAPKGEGR